MAEIKLINADAGECSVTADMIMTDPPFEMSGIELAGIIDGYHAPHLVLFTTMRQLLGFMNKSDWKFGFDFALDLVAPKKSKSLQQPHYLHATGVYLHKPGVKSVFDRKRRQRSDVFEANGYWPTIIRAARERSTDHGHAKNIEAITDILGSFNVASVVDMFGGSGTTGIAAAELDIDCTLIERDAEMVKAAHKALKFIGAKVQIA